MVAEKKSKMETQMVVILILIGIGAGVLSGLIGIGGGIIIVPALVYFLGFTQLGAQGTSLAMLMLPVGFLAVINFYKAGHINYPAVFMIAIGFIIGSYFGSKFALTLPQDTLKKIFAVLMIVIAFKMLFLDRKKQAPAQSSAVMQNDNSLNT